MAKLYSLPIYVAAAQTSGVGAVGPIVPAGLVYVLRDIDVTEQSDTAGALVIVLNSAGGVLWAAKRETTGELGYYEWRGRQVYTAGEQIVFRVLSGTWDIMASGYQLTNP